jgi:RNA polymerase-binding transcription factor DksA
MAVKKKPVKTVKKTQPKKAAKPAVKKAVAKKPAPPKPVKKDSHKKNTHVVKKPAATVSKTVHTKSSVPAKKTVAAPPVAKKSAPVPTTAKKPVVPLHHLTKPPAHAAIKPAAYATAKPAAQATVKPTAQAATKPAVHVATKPGFHAATKPGAHATVKPAANAPVTAKPVQPFVAVAKPGGKGEDKKAVFKQQVKNTSPVTVKPEAKKPVLPPAKAVKVVMPDIKTKTVRKYEPEFTKSVLDIHQQDQSGPTMRYSDVELTEFRELITKKLDSAKKELAYLQGLITRRDEMGGDETDNRYMTMEDGSMSMEREQLSQMASRQITFIDHLEKAMMRIENKTYGICRVTGKLIDKARLKAVPHATLSIEAKQTMNK